MSLSERFGANAAGLPAPTPLTFDSAVKRVAEGDEDPEHALCFSLMRDMLHGLGPAYRVTA